MKFTCDYHSHTRASDGRCEVADHVKRAVELGLEEIAITDHSFSSLFCHQTKEKFSKQHDEIKSFENCGVKVLQGIEANLVSADGDIDVPDDIIRQCDVLHVGFHRFIGLLRENEARRFVLINGYGSDSAREKLKELNTRTFILALQKYPVDAIAHLGHRTPVDFRAVLEEAYKRDVYIELNEKHLDDCNFDKGIADALDIGVKFIVGSDAHTADKLGKFVSVERFIKKFGIPEDRIYGVNGLKPVFKDRSNWKL